MAQSESGDKMFGENPPRSIPVRSEPPGESDKVKTVVQILMGTGRIDGGTAIDLAREIDRVYRTTS
jgi:hypothetical protein